MMAANKIKEIAERFYIEEPLLFEAFCSHQLVINNTIETIRSGGQKIEYNEDFIERISRKEVSEYLKLELIRLLLNHPYQRMQEFKAMAYVSSQLCIGELYTFQIQLPKVEDIFSENSRFYKRQSMDFYYSKFCKEGKQGDGLVPTKTSQNNLNEEEEEEKWQNEMDLDSNNKTGDFQMGEFASAKIMEENADLWGEDIFFSEELNNKILDCILNKSHGTISGNLIDVIKKQIEHKLDYKNILKSFRASLISSERVLTRMKPNRRYGFLNFGSKYSFSTNLLIAVDISGSITTKEIELAFSIINRFFKYGIKTLEFFAFDTEIKGSKHNIKKPSKEFEVKGRGGTDFQCVFDYVKSKPKFDGVIIITDGYAPLPNIYSIPPKKILWLFNNKNNYDKLYSNFNAVGRSAWVEEITN